MFDLSPYVGEISLVAVIALWMFQFLNKEHRLRSNAETETIVSHQMVEFHKSLLDRVRDLEEVVEELQDAKLVLIKENEHLKARLLVMETAHFDLPMPMWLKDTHGVMLSLNKCYEREFLKPLGMTEKDYVGNTDYDVWDKDIAKEYVENDRHVAITDDVWIGAERVQTKRGKRRFGIIKYPRRENNKVIGIAGIAVPTEMLDALGVQT